MRSPCGPAHAGSVAWGALGLLVAPFTGFLALSPMLLALVVLLAGCVIPPAAIRIDEPTAQRLRTEIRVYDQNSLKGLKYKVVLPLEATSRQVTGWHAPATEQNATDQLRLKARTLRANGLMDVTCVVKGISLIRNDLGMVTCNATAIEVSL